MINRTNWLQPLNDRERTSPTWPVALALFTVMSVIVLANLLAGCSAVGASAVAGQDTRPTSGAADPPDRSVPSPVAERKAAAHGVSRSKEWPPLPPSTAAATPSATPTPDRTVLPKDPDRSGVGLPPLLQTIRANESGGDYTAYNPTGCGGASCGGAYQLHASYAPTWAARAGYPGMASNAATWPPKIQDAVALDLFYSTATPGTAWCQWTDYC